MEIAVHPSRRSHRITAFHLLCNPFFLRTDSISRPSGSQKIRHPPTTFQKSATPIPYLRRGWCEENWCAHLAPSQPQPTTCDFFHQEKHYCTVPMMLIPFLASFFPWLTVMSVRSHLSCCCCCTAIISSVIALFPHTHIHTCVHPPTPSLSSLSSSHRHRPSSLSSSSMLLPLHWHCTRASEWVVEPHLNHFRRLLRLGPRRIFCSPSVCASLSAFPGEI